MKTLVEKALQRIWYGFPEDPVGRRISHLLTPAQHLYRLGLRRDQASRLARRRTLPVPVVSVGNLTVGGTGKTPLVRWIARYWVERGIPTAVLSRGYGRRAKDSAPARVGCGGPDPALAARYGDEPVMLACGPDAVPVWVGRDRWQAGMEAVRQDGARVLVLDDGFQYVQLSRSLDVVVLDARMPLGNGRLLPAGPLREPPEALDRAHVIVIMDPPGGFPWEDTGKADSSRIFLRLSGRREEVFNQMEPLGSHFRAGDDDSTKRIVVRARPVIRRFVRAATGDPVDAAALRADGSVAVCGIARPRRFLDTLRAHGIPTKATWIFGDHHRYRESECRKMMRSLDRLKARWIVTTEKDAVRLPAFVLERVVFPLLDVDFGQDGPMFTALLDAVGSFGK